MQALPRNKENRLAGRAGWFTAGGGGTSGSALLGPKTAPVFVNGAGGVPS